MNVGLRIGHKGAVTGSKGTSGNGLVELKMNEDVVDKLKPDLEKKYNFNVYIKNGDLGTLLYNYYNKYLSENDLLCPIHHNGYTPEANGSEVLISIFAKDKAKKHAQMLLSLFVKMFKTKSRGIVQRESESNPGYDYYDIIRKVKPKVILGEPVFLTNKNDANIVKANYNKFIETEANCYERIICSWYGIPYKSNNISSSNTTLEELQKQITSMESKLDKEMMQLGNQLNNIIKDVNVLKNVDIGRVKEIEEKFKKIKGIL